MPVSSSRFELDHPGPVPSPREEREMAPIPAPQLNANLPSSTVIDLDSEYPVGLDTNGPDDLGAFWLDLGCVDLPAGLAV